MKKATPPDAGLGNEPVSARIRRRLQSAGRRFYANDHISDVIQDGELDELIDEVAGRMQAVLESLVIDTDSDHNTQGTARRIAKMYVTEVFRGRYFPEPAVTEFPNAERLNELLIVGPVSVRSACSHHFCPIIGRVWIGLMPNDHDALAGPPLFEQIAQPCEVAAGRELLRWLWLDAERFANDGGGLLGAHEWAMVQCVEGEA